MPSNITQFLYFTENPGYFNSLTNLRLQYILKANQNIVSLSRVIPFFIYITQNIHIVQRFQMHILNFVAFWYDL